MPSNITSNDGLWASAKSDLSLRKKSKSRGAHMKERLSNFSSDSEEISHSPEKEEATISQTESPDVPAVANGQTGIVESQSASTPSPSVVANAKTKRSLFGTRKSSSTSKDKAEKTLDVFRFEGDGLQFKAKLIGMKDVETARGDEMCQLAMQELKNGLKQSKEHKPRINLTVSLSGLKMKDEKASIVMHHHVIPKISYIWRDQTDARAFGYVYGSPDSGHKFAAVKVQDKSADTLVGAIHELFQVAFGLKQREVELAKKGQDDGVSLASDDSGGKKENSADSAAATHGPSAEQHKKVDEANLLDLESELFSLSQGLEQMKSMQASGHGDSQVAWADFGGSSSASSSSSGSSDPWGRSTPQSIRTITPDPFFDAMLPFQGQAHAVVSLATPRPIPVVASSSLTTAQSLVFSPAQSSLFHTQSVPASLSGGDFGPVSGETGSNPFGSYQGSSAFSPATSEGLFFGGTPIEFETTLSVFDAKPLPEPVKEDKKVMDPFSTGPELFGDILQFGKVRTEKTSKHSFPQPIKPTIAGIRGESSVLIPARTTVDPFLIAPSSMGLSVSVSPPNHSTGMMDYFGSGGQTMMPQQAVRKLSSTLSNGFMGAQGSSISPPSLPPRPVALAHSNSAGAFVGLAPPPAPRRSGLAMPIPSAGGFHGGSSSGSLSSSYPVNAFSDPFFTSR